jgi:hypothetical protein
MADSSVSLAGRDPWVQKIGRLAAAEAEEAGAAADPDLLHQQRAHLLQQEAAAILFGAGGASAAGQLRAAAKLVEAPRVVEAPLLASPAAYGLLRAASELEFAADRAPSVTAELRVAPRVARALRGVLRCAVAAHAAPPGAAADDAALTAEVCACAARWEACAPEVEAALRGLGLDLKMPDLLMSAARACYHLHPTGGGVTPARAALTRRCAPRPRPRRAAPTRMPTAASTQFDGMLFPRRAH